MRSMVAVNDPRRPVTGHLPLHALTSDSESTQSMAPQPPRTSQRSIEAVPSGFSLMWVLCPHSDFF